MGKIFVASVAANIKTKTIRSDLAFSVYNSNRENEL